MKRIMSLTLLSVFLITSISAQTVDFKKAFKEAKRIEKGIKRTKFPKREYNIEDYGATQNQPDSPCHEQINQVILDCSLAGGGKVIIPKGVYYCGPITLKSNVNLHFEDGAELRFSTDQNLYFPAVLTRWEVVDCYHARKLIYDHG